VLPVLVSNEEVNAVRIGTVTTHTSTPTIFTALHPSRRTTLASYVRSYYIHEEGDG
jgi:hypothetical protein